MYVCGPTVYNYVHIGNVRPIVVFDVLYRLLKTTYPEVIYARNITDIDDKIIDASNESKQTVEAVTTTYTTAFHHDIAPVGVLPPTIEPRATQHLPQMIEMINRLIEKGNAYKASEHVLFDVSSLSDYGRLSKRSPEDMIAGARVEVAPFKKNPREFVLWKPSNDQQPGWDSPWGRGRPGWHLECSAMAQEYLGNVIDIHGGGQDLVFPHHENEIAQSRCASGRDTFARYWVHNGYVTVKGEKMSKSLNNFFTLRDVLAKWHGETVRYALLSTHYRKPLDWSETALKQAKTSLDKLYRCIWDAGDKSTDVAAPPGDKIIGILSENLNTPAAIAKLHQLAHQGDVEQMRASAALMGLLQHDPQNWFRWRPEAAFGTTLSDEAIAALIRERSQARTAGDYTRADAIKNRLNDAGIRLEDRDGNTRWRRI